MMAQASGGIGNVRRMLLVIEFVLPTLMSKADPALEAHLMSDLNMLAVTGGSEREWRVLLEAAGFRLSGVIPVGSDVGIVEAKPV